jgi:pilus assembly protein CpaC
MVQVNATQGTGTPQTLLNKVLTEVVLKSQESVVIGGAVASKATTNYDKADPGGAKAGTGSALFSFVKSKEYLTERSQFAVFVTPEIVDSASSGTGEIERKFRRKGR